MTVLLNCFFVGLGGFIGSIGRYLLGLIPVGAISFPLMTLIINFVGAWLLGLLSQMGAGIFQEHSQLYLLLTMGLCGGFTTFSTFSLQTVHLLENGKVTLGLLYIGLSVITCLIAIILGRMTWKLF